MQAQQNNAQFSQNQDDQSTVYDANAGIVPV